MMSAEYVEVDVATDICASCGIAEIDDIDFKKCDDCDLVRYCSDKCQQDHSQQHEAKCKERAAELRDDILFRQPDSSHLGDCPICFLPLPIDQQKSTLMGCCCKNICKGCVYADRMRHACPFCRHPVPETKEEANKIAMKRVAANDPVAMRVIGMNHYDEGDYESAFEYYTKAAELGDIDAHHLLAVSYRKGKGVEKDKKLEVHHFEEAAIGGQATARNVLAFHENQNGKIERAMKHFIIAANLGDDDSILMLKECYTDGLVSKEDFAGALRAHYAAADAMKSAQREAAEAV